MNLFLENISKEIIERNQKSYPFNGGQTALEACKRDTGRKV